MNLHDHSLSCIASYVHHIHLVYSVYDVVSYTWLVIIVFINYGLINSFPPSWRYSKHDRNERWWFWTASRTAATKSLVPAWIANELIAVQRKGAENLKYFLYLKSTVPLSKLLNLHSDLPERLISSNMLNNKITVTRNGHDVTLWTVVCYRKHWSKELCSYTIDHQKLQIVVMVKVTVILQKKIIFTVISSGVVDNKTPSFRIMDKLRYTLFIRRM